MYSVQQTTITWHKLCLPIRSTFYTSFYPFFRGVRPHGNVFFNPNWKGCFTAGPEVGPKGPFVANNFRRDFSLQMFVAWASTALKSFSFSFLPRFRKKGRFFLKFRVTVYDGWFMIEMYNSNQCHSTLIKLYRWVKYSIKKLSWCDNHW